MSGSDFSLVDLKGISEPITKLIESVSRGIGVLYEPAARVRNAKAQAKEMMILAEANKEIEKISLRAHDRVVAKELRRQKNIDLIVQGAIESLPPTVSPDAVDEDWVVAFFDLCQDVGSEQMQQIWSKILAGEVAIPGKFHPRTLLTIKSMTQKEAEMFTILCSFSFASSDGLYYLPVFDHNFFEFIRSNGITTDVETHLKNVGLLSHSTIWLVRDDVEGEYERVSYFTEYYDIRMQKVKAEGFQLQTYPFTNVGNELAAISGALPNHKYIDVLIRGGRLVNV